MTERMVLDARDRESLWLLMKPFVEQARPHIEGAKIAGLSSSIVLPVSVEECERVAETHKAHIDAIVAIKRKSQAVRDAFVPEFPSVSILAGASQ
jgi:hypothetical protein